MPELDREVAVVCKVQTDAPRLAMVSWHSSDPGQITVSNSGGLLGRHFSTAYARAYVVPGVEIAYTFRCEDCRHSSGPILVDELRNQAAQAWDQRHGSHGVLKV